MIFVFETVFLVLKLCNLIEWNWGIVLIPFYIDLIFNIIKKTIDKIIDHTKNNKGDSSNE